MKRSLVFILLLLIAALPGCWIFFIDQPSTADVGDTIDLAVTMHYEMGSSGMDTTLWCAALPDDWSTASEVTFEFVSLSSMGLTYASGTGIDSPTDSAMLDSEYPVSTSGQLSEWNCYAIAPTDYSGEEGMVLKMQAQVGPAGAYTVYYAGFSRNGISGDILAKKTVVGGKAGMFDSWSLANGLAEGGKSLPPGLTYPPMILTAVAYENGTYVAVGSDVSGPGGSISFYSDDGKTWNIGGEFGTAQTQHVKYGNGMFIASEQGNLIWTSPDGDEWSSLDPGIDLESATYGEGLYVAVGGEGSLAWSDDGMAWTTTVIGDVGGTWTDVTYADGRFVVIGENLLEAAFLISPDGMSWTNTIIPGSEMTNDLGRIAYGMGKYWATGEYPVIYSSTDGSVWSTVALEDSIENAILGLAVGGDYVMVTGTRAVDNIFSSFIYTTKDGIEWSRWSPGTGEVLLGAVYADDRFTVVGGGLLIMTSDKVGGGKGGGGGCNTVPSSNAPFWPELIMMMTVLGIVVLWRYKSNNQS